MPLPATPMMPQPRPARSGSTSLVLMLAAPLIKAVLHGGAHVEAHAGFIEEDPDAAVITSARPRTNTPVDGDLMEGGLNEPRASREGWGDFAGAEDGGHICVEDRLPQVARERVRGSFSNESVD